MWSATTAARPQPGMMQTPPSRSSVWRRSPPLEREVIRVGLFGRQPDDGEVRRAHPRREHPHHRVHGFLVDSLDGVEYLLWTARL
jgi:hypothetical protein